MIKALTKSRLTTKFFLQSKLDRLVLLMHIALTTTSRFLHYEAECGELREANLLTAEEELELEAEKKAINEKLIKKRNENRLTEEE
jgi:hypothetical protein